jgi:hypothetical protein
VGALLIAAMVAGSVAMWMAVPYVWIWVASQVADTQGHLTLAPVMIIIVCIPASMIAIAFGLARLNDLYYRVTETAVDERPQQAAWLHSMRGDRAPKRQRTVLDTVMVISVVVALIALEAWYILLAGSPVPSGTPLPGPG